MSARSVRFSSADLDWFARVSDDRSPLHVDEGFSQRSAFGGRVVHGVLTALASLATLSPSIGRAPRRIVCEFQRPVFREVDYSVTLDDVGDAKHAFRIADGSLLHLRGMVDLGAPEGSRETSPQLFTPGDVLVAARSWATEDLRPGLELVVPYGMSRESYDAVEARFSLEARGFAPWQTMVLIGTSYVVGMHMPGERALFSRLELDFIEDAKPAGRLTFDCKVKSFDPRISIVRVDVRVRSGDALVAKGELQAFARRRSPVPAVVENEDRALEGRVAVVVGASRGLGASLSLALAARGATVFGTFVRSSNEARALETAARGLGGTITMVQGDGKSVELCEALRTKAVAGGRTLDFLFCNASPALRPLWIERASRDRLEAYVSESFRLFATPLTTLLADVTRGTGWVVASSSIAVKTAVAEWPHYVAAKAAIEGLLHVAAKENPTLSFLIVRPPALLTDFAPNLGSLQSALPPERVARAIVSRLVGSPTPGNIGTLDAF